MSGIFDEYAEIYDKWFQTPEGRKVFELELNALLEIIKPRQNMKMLDIGIGTGIFASEFAERGVTVYGIDPSEKMIEIAHKKGFNARLGSGEYILFGDNLFDVILSMTSAEFSVKPERFLSEMVRVAKPGGLVVLAVLNLLSFYGIRRRIQGLFQKTIFRDAHFYSFWELRALLERHLQSVEVTSSVFFNPHPPEFILERADKLETLGHRYFLPFGALLVGFGVKYKK
jgi:ubiquinone/menaquinone biosynthesis C-methylase UbiE